MKKTTPKRSRAAFQKEVYAHLNHSGRAELPWRKTTDPYRILVSELMLQQTQVPRVIEKYRAFLKRFPTLRSLAKAKLSDVLLAWQGLGYNRRAKHVHDLAKVVVAEHKGKIPSTPEALRTLPGIGPYTASAILAFAFDKASVLIETNVRTVYTHHFFPGKGNVSDAALLPLIEQTMDRKHPRKWYSALMDYGTYLKANGVRINSRSAHYVKQSKFEGSRRQLRGQLLRALLAGKKTLPLLVREIGGDRKNIAEELNRLQSEQLIHRIRGGYSI